MTSIFDTVFLNKYKESTKDFGHNSFANLRFWIILIFKIMTQVFLIKILVVKIYFANKNSWHQINQNIWISPQKNWCKNVKNPHNYLTNFNFYLHHINWIQESYHTVNLKLHEFDTRIVNYRKFENRSQFKFFSPYGRASV